ncbi:hypothetical protein OUZ56_004480 [Daphnia magna]|uniref:Uncharacterized protein n=1 Tax=Daphnia magna TaxID=35525 RepID=A0ABQ9YPY2_9CRUS|nr:hypothetical protein OUZ56_004480 [Daphnia magna]
MAVQAENHSSSFETADETADMPIEILQRSVSCPVSCSISRGFGLRMAAETNVSLLETLPPIPRNMAWLGFASTFFISDVPDVLWWQQNHSMTWFNPGCEILEAPDVFHWRLSHSVTEENATNVMLSV